MHYSDLVYLRSGKISISYFCLFLFDFGRNIETSPLTQRADYYMIFYKGPYRLKHPSSELFSDEGLFNVREECSFRRLKKE